MQPLLGHSVVVSYTRIMCESAEYSILIYTLPVFPKRTEESEKILV
jgi:hypothetical protein